MKSLLIVAEQFGVGGLETHIRGEILHFIKNGYAVHLAVGRSFDATLLPEGLASLQTGLPLGPDANLADTVKTIETFRRLIRAESVDVVHAHPFSSILPAVLAAEAEQVLALVSLHGPASLGAYGGALHEVLLKQVLLPSASAVICVSDEVRRLAAPYVSPDRLMVFPNGVQFPPVTAAIDSLDPRWCIASRLDELKIIGILDFVAKAKQAGVAGVVIIGDGPARAALEAQLAQAGLLEDVEFVGYQANAPLFMQRYAGVAGMGRVLLEGVAARKPVVLVGYDGVKGVVTEAFIDQARFCNFSGRGLDTIDANTLQDQLARLTSSDRVALYGSARQAFDEDISWSRLRERLRVLTPPSQSVAGAALDVLSAQGALSDLPPEPIFESSKFSDQLQQLSLSRNFYSPGLLAVLEIRRNQDLVASLSAANAQLQEQIAQSQVTIAHLESTIAQLQGAAEQSQGVVERVRQTLSQANEELHARDADLARANATLQARDKEVVVLQRQFDSMKETVVERESDLSVMANQAQEAEARIKALEQQCAETQTLRLAVTETQHQYAGKVQELNAITSSKSWQLTQPVRIALWRMRNPRVAAYGVARSFYWSLPASLRSSLNEPRHRFVRMVRGSQPPASNIVQDGDLSWEQFAEQVLSKRGQYKGVFVQELVIDWNVPLYQRPQHMAAALGQLGYLVIYKTDNWAGDDVNGFRIVSRGVWITNRREVDKIDGVIRSVYSTAYANTPELLMEHGKRGHLIYEYIDHIDPEISGDDGNIKRLLALKEFAFSGGADLIVASARKLYDEAVAHVGAHKVALVQNGVDTKHYRDPAHAQVVVSPKFADFRARFTTIIGYFGALAPWLWYDEVRKIIELRPDLGFVFIGPDYYGGAAQLPLADNVLYLGAIDYKILPAYAQGFDVCFIPFKPGEIARTTSPLKLFEYFALEKPVVVTSEMAECVYYPEVLSGDSAATLSAALDEAIAKKDVPTFKKRLAALADENNWLHRAEAMAASVPEKI